MNLKNMPFELSCKSDNCHFTGSPGRFLWVSGYTYKHIYIYTRRKFFRTEIVEEKVSYIFYTYTHSESHDFLDN
jgi:hypothetical protein